MEDIKITIGKCEAILDKFSYWVENQIIPSKAEILQSLNYLYKQCVEARKWFDEHEPEDNQWEDYEIYFWDIGWYYVEFIETDDIEILAAISRVLLLNYRTKMYYSRDDSYKQTTFLKI